MTTRILILAVAFFIVGCSESITETSPFVDVCEGLKISPGHLEMASNGKAANPKITGNQRVYSVGAHSEDNNVVSASWNGDSTLTLTPYQGGRAIVTITVDIGQHGEPCGLFVTVNVTE